MFLVFLYEERDLKHEGGQQRERGARAARGGLDRDCSDFRDNVLYAAAGLVGALVPEGHGDEGVLEQPACGARAQTRVRVARDRGHVVGERHDEGAGAVEAAELCGPLRDAAHCTRQVDVGERGRDGAVDRDQRARGQLVVEQAAVVARRGPLRVRDGDACCALRVLDLRARRGLVGAGGARGAVGTDNIVRGVARGLHVRVRATGGACSADAVGGPGACGCEVLGRAARGARGAHGIRRA